MGRVQGVSFRYFVQQNASKLGLNGWVRNRLDRSVELEAEGQKDQLEQLVVLLHQGPRGSRVDSVDVQWGEGSGDHQKFEIRPTR